jgi:hypothetical protein
MTRWPHKPPVPYVHQEYPKFVNDRIVLSAEEEAALLGADTADERTTLIEIAAARGVKIDKRWSDDKIRAAIEAA